LQLLGSAVARRIGLDPGPHEADLQAEGLVSVAAAIVLPHTRELLAVPLERGLELGRHRGEPFGYGEARGKVGEAPRVVAEYGAAGAARGGERDLRARDLLGALARLTQAPQRPAHRSALCRGQVVLPRPSHPMSLFRGVDQNEKHRERAGRETRRLRWEGSGPREQGVQVGCPGDAEASGAARPAQLLDGAECFFPGQPADDPAERRGQPTHVLAELRIMGPGDGRRKRNSRGDGGGGHGGERLTIYRVTIPARLT